jgi:hypothetical protein
MPEILSREQLQTLYDNNVAGRKIGGKLITFDEWLATREKARTDKDFLKQLLETNDTDGQ